MPDDKTDGPPTHRWGVQGLGAQPLGEPQVNPYQPPEDEVSPTVDEPTVPAEDISDPVTVPADTQRFGAQPLNQQQLSSPNPSEGEASHTDDEPTSPAEETSGPITVRPGAQQLGAMPLGGQQLSSYQPPEDEAIPFASQPSSPGMAPPSDDGALPFQARQPPQDALPPPPLPPPPPAPEAPPGKHTQTIDLAALHASIPTGLPFEAAEPPLEGDRPAGPPVSAEPLGPHAAAGATVVLDDGELAAQLREALPFLGEEGGGLPPQASVPSATPAVGSATLDLDVDRSALLPHGPPQTPPQVTGAGPGRPPLPPMPLGQPPAVVPAMTTPAAAPPTHGVATSPHQKDLARYGRVKAALLDGAKKNDTLHANEVSYEEWLRLEALFGRQQGDDVDGRAVQDAIAEARRERQAETSGGHASETDMLAFAALRAEVEASGDAKGTLQRHGLTPREFRDVKRSWSRRALGDDHIAGQLRTALAAARRNQIGIAH